jgi:hypothetical protein
MAGEPAATTYRAVASLNSLTEENQKLKENLAAASR